MVVWNWLPQSLAEGPILFRSKVGAIILIAVGCLLLASNLGYLPRLGPLFHQCWPLILIVVGAWMLLRQ